MTKKDDYERGYDQGFKDGLMALLEPLEEIAKLCERRGGGCPNCFTATKKARNAIALAKARTFGARSAIALAKGEDAL